MSTDERPRIGQGSSTGGRIADAIDFAWELHAVRDTLRFQSFKNHVALLRYLDDEGYPGAYLEWYDNDPGYFVVRDSGYIDHMRREVVRELRGVDTDVLAAVDRLALIDTTDSSLDRRAVRDVTTMFDQIRESIHNKIRDYDGTP